MGIETGIESTEQCTVCCVVHLVLCGAVHTEHRTQQKQLLRVVHKWHHVPPGQAGV